MDLFTVQTKQLMIERVKTAYQQGKLKPFFTLGQFYSPEQQVEEIEKGTAVGEQILLAQKKLMDELKRLGGIP